jgi:hypothetical protein
MGAAAKRPQGFTKATRMRAMAKNQPKNRLAIPSIKRSRRRAYTRCAGGVARLANCGGGATMWNFSRKHEF